MNISQQTLPDEIYDQRRTAQNQMRRWGILLLLVGSVWLVFEVTGRGAFLWNSLGFVEKTRQVAEVVPGQNLNIDVVSDDIVLETWEQPDIRIEATRHAFGWSGDDAERTLDDMGMQIQRVDDTVYIKAMEHPWLRFRRAPYISFRIVLPRQAHVTIRSVNGDIQADALSGEGTFATVNGDITLENTRGSLVVRTTSGDVRIHDHAGALDITTTSGETHINGNQSNPIAARSSNGDMFLEGIMGRVTARTISGDITITAAQQASLDVESVRGDLAFSGSLAPATGQRMRSSAGDIDLYLAHTGNIQLSAETLSGDLESELDLYENQRTSRLLNGIAGDGSIHLSIITDSGDIGLYSQ